MIEQQLVELQEDENLQSVLKDVRVFAVDSPFFPPSKSKVCPLYKQECQLGNECMSKGLLQNLNTFGRYGQPDWSRYYYVEKHTDKEYLRWWGCENGVGFEFKEADVT